MVNDAKGVLGDEWKVLAGSRKLLISVDFCCLGWGSMLIDNDPWWPFLENDTWSRHFCGRRQAFEFHEECPLHILSRIIYEAKLQQFPSVPTPYPSISYISGAYLNGNSRILKWGVLYITVPYKAIEYLGCFFFYIFSHLPAIPAGPSRHQPRAGGGRLGRRAAGAAGGSFAQRGAGAAALATGAGGGDAAVGHGDPWIWNDEMCGLQYIFPSFYVSIWLSVYLSVWLSDCLSMYISISLSIYIHTYNFYNYMHQCLRRSDHLLSMSETLGRL